MVVIVSVGWTWAPLWGESCSVSPNAFKVGRPLEGKAHILEDKGRSGPGEATEACLASQTMHL